MNKFLFTFVCVFYIMAQAKNLIADERNLSIYIYKQFYVPGEDLNFTLFITPENINKPVLIQLLQIKADTSLVVTGSIIQPDGVEFKGNLHLPDSLISGYYCILLYNRESITHKAPIASKLLFISRTFISY